MTANERRLIRELWKFMWEMAGPIFDCPWLWINDAMGEAMREAWQDFPVAARHYVPPFLGLRIGLFHDDSQLESGSI